VFEEVFFYKTYWHTCRQRRGLQYMYLKIFV